MVERHHLGRTAPDVENAVDDLVALHSSDPPTPHLALWARVPGFEPSHLDAALCDRRSLWRLHAMRRTIWVVGAAVAPVVEAAAGRKVAAAERRRVVGWLGEDADVDDPAGMLAGLEARVLAALDAGPRSTRELSTSVEGFDRRVTLGSGRWAQAAPIGPRVLFLLAMDLAVVRGANSGSFRSSQYEWARTADWFGAAPEPLDVRDAQRRLCTRYLLRFGPVTSDDVRWWHGWTKRDTTRALADAGAAPVLLDDGAEAWLHPDDPGLGRAVDADAVALLPSLDPTSMGWRGRGFYVEEAMVPELFDRNGNVGPTVWSGGRIVGGWYVRADATVDAVLLADVGAGVEAGVTAEVARLEAWLDDAVTPRFPTPLERRLRGG